MDGVKMDCNAYAFRLMHCYVHKHNCSRLVNAFCVVGEGWGLVESWQIQFILRIK